MNKIEKQRKCKWLLFIAKAMSTEDACVFVCVLVSPGYEMKYEWTVAEQEDFDSKSLFT